jgi:hypothetical protein
MKMLKLSAVLMGLSLVGFAGCGSSDTEQYNPLADTGVEPVIPDAGPVGPTLYAITPGTWCYKVTTLSAVSDGCDTGAATMVGKSIPGTYDATTGIFTLGTSGSLGGGAISNNVGALVRTKATVSDPATPGCSWKQADNTTINMTAENTFTASVVETQDTIASACGLAATTCTSSWTWSMEIDGTQSAAAGCI